MTSVTSPVERLFRRAVLDPLQATVTAGRAGLADPRRVVAVSRGLARWGPSLAAAYAAGSHLHPQRPAVVDEAGALTFAELDAWTDRVAAGLVARGAAVVGVLCRNHRGFVVAAVAGAKAGLDTVYLNPGSSAVQLAAVLRREGVTHLVHDDEFAELSRSTDTVRQRVDEHGLGVLGEHDGPPPPRPARVGSPVLLTSGTTGVPKGARRRRSVPDPAAATGLLAVIPYRVGDVFVIPAPLFHAWGFSQLATAAVLGAPVVLRRRFDPATTPALVTTSGGTVLSAVPVMLQRILDAAPPAPPPPQLRIVATSGSAFTAGVAAAWMDRFGDSLYHLYGSTEVGQATVAGPADLRAAPGTAGRALPGVRVAVVDGDGRPVPTGTTGRIVVGSSWGFAGYTDGGAKPVVDGMIDTGDLGHFDPDGRLYVTGRRDDMIVTGGENVFPQEVEDTLAGHPAVREVTVVGVPDPVLGQRVRAVVVTRPGARVTAEELRAHVRQRLARHAVPRDVLFVDELPRNAAGKVLRTALTGPTVGGNA